MQCFRRARAQICLSVCFMERNEVAATLFVAVRQVYFATLFFVRFIAIDLLMSDL